MEVIQELDCREGTCNINRYVNKRIQNNHISKIINMERQEISPAAYCLLRNSQPISASVKRSFSMLKKLLAKDRNFKAENVTQRFYTLIPLPGDWLVMLYCNTWLILQNQIGLFCNFRWEFACFRLLNVCFNINSQKISFICPKYVRLI